MKRISFFSIFISLFCVSAFAQTDQITPCPEITVKGPASISAPGETMTFTANVKDGDSLKYEWTVTAGTIIEGQNSPVIRVATTPEMAGVTVTANVEVKGLPENCAKTASEWALVNVGCGLPLDLDDYEKISFKEEKERLKVVATHLINQPEAKAFFIIYFPEKQNLQQQNYTEKIKNHLTLTLKIPKDRLTFVYGESKTQRTRIMLAPKDALGVEPNQ